jgi:hypothetical protein
VGVADSGQLPAAVVAAGVAAVTSYQLVRLGLTVAFLALAVLRYRRRR